MGRMEGKIALITGGASGLGRETAALFVREGGRVAVTDINVKGGRAVADEIGDGAIFLDHDVTSEDQWIAVLDQTMAAFGGLHVLVNSAGIGLSKSVEDIELEEWRKVHAIDLDGVFLGCKHAIAKMAASGGGRSSSSRP